MIHNRDVALWEAAEALIHANKIEEAISVIDTISSYITGNQTSILNQSKVPMKNKKHFDLEQLDRLKRLSVEVSDLKKVNQPDRFQEKLVEYLDGIVDFLSVDHAHAAQLRKYYFSPLIRVAANSDQQVSLEESPSREISKEFYTSSETALILGVSDQTVRRMCDNGKFPEANRTDGGHWRIPAKYFKVSPQEVLHAEQKLKKVHSKALSGGLVDEFDVS
ncbi:helix-turn-helix domain-containing protein [Jeotgalibacillus malaysiensis]|uniref:helix-turn-helix domain-containing protein n=1 Tax=Jeotgalibacillus malaysiensis TaxID=1508404 RepID=UPI00384F49B7